MSCSGHRTDGSQRWEAGVSPGVDKNIDCFTPEEKNASISQTVGRESAGQLPPVAARQPEGILVIDGPKGQGVQPGSGEALRLVRAGFKTHRHHGRHLMVLLPVVGKLLLKEL
jgi:hypothetical protein